MEHPSPPVHTGVKPSVPSPQGWPLHALQVKDAAQLPLVLPPVVVLGAQGTSAIKLVKALMEAGFSVTAGVRQNLCGTPTEWPGSGTGPCGRLTTTGETQHFCSAILSTGVDYLDEAQATLAFVKKYELVRGQCPLGQRSGGHTHM